MPRSAKLTAREQKTHHPALPPNRGPKGSSQTERGKSRRPPAPKLPLDLQFGPLEPSEAAHRKDHHQPITRCGKAVVPGKHSSQDLRHNDNIPLAATHPARPSIGPPLGPLEPSEAAHRKAHRLPPAHHPLRQGGCPQKAPRPRPGTQRQHPPEPQLTPVAHPSVRHPAPSNPAKPRTGGHTAYHHQPITRCGKAVVPQKHRGQDPGHNGNLHLSRNSPCPPIDRSATRPPRTQRSRAPEGTPPTTTSPSPAAARRAIEARLAANQQSQECTQAKFRRPPAPEHPPQGTRARSHLATTHSAPHRSVLDSAPANKTKPPSRTLNSREHNHITSPLGQSIAVRTQPVRASNTRHPPSTSQSQNRGNTPITATHYACPVSHQAPPHPQESKLSPRSHPFPRYAAKTWHGKPIDRHLKPMTRGETKDRRTNLVATRSPPTERRHILKSPPPTLTNASPIAARQARHAPQFTTTVPSRPAADHFFERSHKPNLPPLGSSGNIAKPNSDNRPLPATKPTTCGTAGHRGPPYRH
jgi:hypothetical protein